ncbi:hypothetical protein L5515_012781 [Caenorhabditis briggsae]|uniref:Uncharacterized protein n=2 Tax=Caenorhabditis briggsae TaxID=6238 RepID=A0AAE9EZN9_CAEBR|nr:hypothetical protein L3Y34_005698 [Caenorhabditis briggsae]UMM31208.1 hypothetical protein L5515_012781 [Caenorhabditis briggsae]
MTKLRFPFMKNQTIAKCIDLYQASPVDTTTIILHLVLILGGLVSNISLHFMFSGRPKLGTASFAYIRIIGMFQLAFFITPFPLKILTDHYQAGQTWIAANFLPVLLALFHFVISTLCLCFTIRLLLLLNCIRRCRRWSSVSWVAWQKIFCLLPFGTIVNVPLCFEWVIDYEQCVFGKELYAIGRPHLSEAALQNHIKTDLIRIIPTIIFWITAFCTLVFFAAEKCILPKLSSPYAAKHIPLFSNLQPLLIAFILSHATVHVYTTIHILYDLKIPDSTRNQMFGISYALPFPIMLIISRTFRSHLFHLISNFFEGLARPPKMRKDSTLQKMTSQIARHMAFSKLEMENSELDERLYSNLKVNNMRSILRDDAVYRVRFAIPQQTVQIIQEEDNSENDISIFSRE